MSLLTSIIIVSTDELPLLTRCLESIYRCSDAPYEVVVVDNASSDGTTEQLAKRWPSVNVVTRCVNTGYGAAANAGMARAKGELFAILNADVQVCDGWLAAMVHECEHDIRVGLVAPKIVYAQRGDEINACGLDVMPSGLAFCRGLGQPRCSHNGHCYVAAVSGAAFVIRRSVVEDIGGFAESYFMYHEDVELSARAQLAGYLCSYVPEAIVAHRYRPQINGRKLFYVERNRYYTLARSIRWQTLLFLLPLLCITEALMWSYATCKGPKLMWAKLMAYASLVRHWPSLWRYRHNAQARPQHEDILLKHLSWTVPLSYVGPNRVAQMALRVLNHNYAVCKLLFCALNNIGGHEWCRHEQPTRE